MKNVKEKWVPGITHHSLKNPFLLVGTQIALIDDPSTIEKLARTKRNLSHQISIAEYTEKPAGDLKTTRYVECSAFTQRGLENVFTEAILISRVSRTKGEPQVCVAMNTSLEPFLQGWYQQCTKISVEIKTMD